jgi:hypothetical protein
VSLSYAFSNFHSKNEKTCENAKNTEYYFLDVRRALLQEKTVWLTACKVISLESQTLESLLLLGCRAVLMYIFCLPATGTGNRQRQPATGNRHQRPAPATGHRLVSGFFMVGCGSLRVPSGLT